MTILKKFDFSGKEVGEDEIEDKFLKAFANAQMVKEYIVAISKNRRRWTANTKDKAEVKATGKKPHAQKGLGRARQGSLVSPQFRGGGVVFGPKPKFNQKIKINKKERHLVIKTLLAERIKEDRVCIVENLLKEPKTKKAFNFFNKLNLLDKRVLFLATKEDKVENTKKSIRNIPKKDFSFIEVVNGYDLALSLNIVILGWYNGCFRNDISQSLFLIGENNKNGSYNG